MTKLTGKDGFLYYGKKMPEITSGNLEDKRFYKILEKAGDSALPEALSPGDICIGKSSIELKDGDKLLPFELIKVAFVTDISDSPSKEKFENTTQIDEYKSYVSSKRVDVTGTFNGYFTLGDDAVKDIVSQFEASITYNPDGTVVKKEVSSDVLHFFLTRNETNIAGEVNVTEYKPVVFDSLSKDKPMDGNQPFNANYSVVGSQKPCTIYEVIS